MEVLGRMKHKAPPLGKEWKTVETDFSSCGLQDVHLVNRKHPASTVVKPVYGSMVFAGKAQSTALSWMSLKKTQFASRQPFRVPVVDILFKSVVLGCRFVVFLTFCTSTVLQFHHF